MHPDDLTLARTFAHAQHDEALELLRSLARIPAPSHREQRRATFVCDWFHTQGLPGAFIDAAGNVVCPIHDTHDNDLIVFAAHMDVVFPDMDELPLHEEDGKIYAPGVGDDTANLVALLMAAREMAAHPAWLPDGCGYLVVANTCEEGLGNLKGCRQLFADYASRIRRFYSFDLYLPDCVCEAVGSHRWQIRVRTQGGHSFGDFGRPNAIERSCALIEALYQLRLPQDVPATLNVGTIEGGTTINAIASQACFSFEYRSTSDPVLQDLRSQMAATVDSHRSDEVAIDLESLGERPASVKTSAQLQRMTDLSCHILQAITGEQPVRKAASTDANIPLSLGIPANTLGAVRGALLHTRDEWVDATSVEEGLAVVLAVMRAQRVLG